jgi:endoglucanase
MGGGVARDVSSRPDFQGARHSRLGSHRFLQVTVNRVLPDAENPGGPKAVFDEFDLVTRYVEKTKRRVYLGEFGVLDTADAASRARFVHLVRTEAERRGIGWAVWDDGGLFKVLVVRSRKLVPYLRRALFD